MAEEGCKGEVVSDGVVMSKTVRRFLDKPGVLAGDIRQALILDVVDPGRVDHLLAELTQIANDGRQKRVELNLAVADRAGIDRANAAGEELRSPDVRMNPVSREALVIALMARLAGKNFKNPSQFCDFLAEFADSSGLEMLPRGGLNKRAFRDAPDTYAIIGEAVYGIRFLGKNIMSISSLIEIKGAQKAGFWVETCLGEE